MTLSPAAQKVIDAVYAVPLVDERLCRDEVAVRTAAALRAAVEQVLPEAPIRQGGAFMRGVDERSAEVRAKFLAIATELENAS